MEALSWETSEEPEAKAAVIVASHDWRVGRAFEKRLSELCPGVTIYDVPGLDETIRVLRVIRERPVLLVADTTEPGSIRTVRLVQAIRSRMQACRKPLVLICDPADEHATAPLLPMETRAFKPLDAGRVTALAERFLKPYLVR